MLDKSEGPSDLELPTGSVETFGGATLLPIFSLCPTLLSKPGSTGVDPRNTPE